MNVICFICTSEGDTGIEYSDLDGMGARGLIREEAKKQDEVK